MLTKKQFKKSINFKAHLQEKLKDPKFKKLYDEAGKQLEIAYRVQQLRKANGVSQSQMAKKLGTTQSNIARLEAGQQNLTNITLHRIAKAFDRDLKIEFV
jgi:DNA-binding XRE family transcriptional regulator